MPGIAGYKNDANAAMSAIAQLSEKPVPALPRSTAEKTDFVPVKLPS